MKQDIANYEEQLKAMMTERNETEADAQALLTCIEEVKAQLEEGDDNFDGKPS